jgi:hypothetical protein
MKSRNRRCASSRRTIGRLRRSVRRWHLNNALNGVPCVTDLDWLLPCT